MFYFYGAIVQNYVDVRWWEEVVNNNKKNYLQHVTSTSHCVIVKVLTLLFSLFSVLQQSNIIDVSEDTDIKPDSIWLKKLPYTKLEMFLEKQPFYFPMPSKPQESLFALLKLMNSLLLSTYFQETKEERRGIEGKKSFCFINLSNIVLKGKRDMLLGKFSVISDICLK